MPRMTDPIHPDLPCLFACAIVPALCSVVIPDAWHFMGLAAAYGPFLPAVYHPFVLTEAGGTGDLA